MSKVLILKEAPYGSREEEAEMTRLMQGEYAGKPEACTLCGNSPVVAGAQFRNPLGNVNYTHHLCEPCADQYDIMHSSDEYKGEPMDIAWRLLKGFDEVIAEYRQKKLDHILSGKLKKYAPIHEARKLATRENRAFRDDVNRQAGLGEELPLENINRETFGGRFAFPNHAYSFNPNIGSTEGPDLLPSSKENNRVLDLYGFNAVPQRYGKNLNAEGIIYGDLEEDQVRRLNKNPFLLSNLQAAARTLMPGLGTKPSNYGGTTGERKQIQVLARMLMENEIPGALYDKGALNAYDIESIDHPVFQDPTEVRDYLIGDDVHLPSMDNIEGNKASNLPC